jgi:hypothetical protein
MFNVESVVVISEQIALQQCNSKCIWRVNDLCMPHRLCTGEDPFPLRFISVCQVSSASAYLCGGRCCGDRATCYIPLHALSRIPYITATAA